MKVTAERGILTDRLGRPIASVVHEIHGIEIAVGIDGVLAFFDPRRNVTVDVAGGFVVAGNLWAWALMSPNASRRPLPPAVVKAVQRAAYQFWRLPRAVKKVRRFLRDDDVVQDRTAVTPPRRAAG